MSWRSWDRPIIGTIFRLPDITSLVRGITFTILPDGESMRVPAMNRAEVRAHANKHADGEENEVMQALHDLMHGKVPLAGRGARDAQGVHGAQRVRGRGDPAGRRGGIRAPRNIEPRNGMPLQVVQEM